MYKRSRRTRFFVRADKPVGGIFPLGLLGLLLIFIPLLYGLFWFAKNNIESNTRSAVEKKLLGSGLNWLNVEIDGQDVTLRGDAQPAEAKRALEIAQASLGSTWLGRLIAPISVKFVQEAGDDPSSQVAAVAPTQDAVLHWGNLVSTLDNGVLELKGVVGDRAEERALIQNAKNSQLLANVEKISHELEVVPSSYEGALELAMLATSMLSHCISGSASTNEGVLELSCDAEAAGAEAIASLKATPLANGGFGKIDVRVKKSCESDFIEVLDVASIHFDEGSNVLPEVSNQQFDDIAKLMIRCPKLLRIDGHTDDSGDMNFNMNLSFRRAMAGVEALVARGVDRKYIVPYAFGPNKPHSTEKNDTARATNRRIEIHLFNEG